jgi:hypothetical protein
MTTYLILIVYITSNLCILKLNKLNHPELAIDLPVGVDLVQCLSLRGIQWAMHCAGCEDVDQRSMNVWLHEQCIVRGAWIMQHIYAASNVLVLLLGCLCPITRPSWFKWLVVVRRSLDKHGMVHKNTRACAPVPLLAQSPHQPCMYGGWVKGQGQTPKTSRSSVCG